jgi:hypothetical protein
MPMEVLIESLVPAAGASFLAQPAVVMRSSSAVTVPRVMA